MKNIDDIKKQYHESIFLYKKLCEEVYHQIVELIHQNNVKLAVPIEHRVKELSSIIMKTEKYENVKSLSDINDVAGIRIITVFEKDVDLVCGIVDKMFCVIRKEDTRKRLKENQFGYGSIHYEITLKEEWCGIPTFTGLNGLKLEIQVRTAAQHIWAISSHILQYKRESHVPDSVKRSINRVAALLELVDLEYTRALEEQSKYVNDISHDRDSNSSLNIENLKLVLRSKLPKENEDINEDYSELLDDLSSVDINTTEKLTEFIDENIHIILSEEQQAIKAISEEPETCFYKYRPERLEKGVFYTHVGLVRQGLEFKFGMEFNSDPDEDDEFDNISNFEDFEVLDE